MHKGILSGSSFTVPLINQCPICRSTLLSFHSHPLYKSCRKCFAIFQVSEIHEILDYFLYSKLDYSHQSGSYKYYIRLMSRFIDFEQQNTIVDVGAGDGTFLEICKHRFGIKNLFAVEISQTAKNTLLEKGIDVVSADHLAQIDKKIVTAFQVIEHIADPKFFIETLHLRAGDYFILTSPAVDSIYCKLYGRKWWALSPSHHIILYSRRSLEILCRETGLKVLYFGLCVSGRHGLFDSFLRYILTLIARPVRYMLGQSASFPLFYGKNSFLAILVKG